MVSFGVLWECSCEMLHSLGLLPLLWRGVGSVDGIVQGRDLSVF